MQPKEKELVDLNQNGIVDEEDVKNYERICEVDAKLIRDKTQIALAWVAMISMVVVTLLLFLPLVSVDRLVALGDILDLFYVTQSGVIAFFIGAKTWLTSRRTGQAVQMSRD